MTDALRQSLEALLSGDVAAWSGLPPGLALDDLEPVVNLARDVRGRGRLGSDFHDAMWISAESRLYEGGLRVWISGDEVALLEGEDPFDAEGKPLRAPDLGPPEAVLDTKLADVPVREGELVYAARGLALRTNPGNGLLLGVRAFAPTTADEYSARLRPFVPPERPLSEPIGSGGAL